MCFRCERSAVLVNDAIKTMIYQEVYSMGQSFKLKEMKDSDMAKEFFEFLDKLELNTLEIKTSSWIGFKGHDLFPAPFNFNDALKFEEEYKILLEESEKESTNALNEVKKNPQLMQFLNSLGIPLENFKFVSLDQINNLEEPSDGEENQGL